MPSVIGCRNGFQSCAPWVRKVTVAEKCAALRRADRAVAQSGQPAPSNPVFYQNHSGYSAAALKLWSTVLDSFAATVTFWSCSPSFSCTKAIV